MKRRYYPLLFALVQVPFCLTMAVCWRQGQENARWSEKTISSESYRANIVSVALPPTNSQERWRRLQQVTEGEGFKLRAISPDGSRLLAEGPYHTALLLDARDANIVANLIKIWDCNWENEQFSPDGRVVTFTQIVSKSTLRQCFAVATGEQLGSDTHTSDDILFSPNGKYLAYKTRLSFRPDTFTVRQTVTGRDTSLRPRMGLKGQGNFSRDSRFFLVETAQGKHIRYPLR